MGRAEGISTVSAGGMRLGTMGWVRTMARHRFNRGLTTSRARHRAAGPVQAVLERGLNAALASAATAVLVMSLFLNDPTVNSRA